MKYKNVQWTKHVTVTIRGYEYIEVVRKRQNDFTPEEVKAILANNKSVWLKSINKQKKI